jgi:hypothetical protein
MIDPAVRQYRSLGHAVVDLGRLHPRLVLVENGKLVKARVGPVEISWNDRAKRYEWRALDGRYWRPLALSSVGLHGE